MRLCVQLSEIDGNAVKRYGWSCLRLGSLPFPPPFDPTATPSAFPLNAALVSLTTSPSSLLSPSSFIINFLVNLLSWHFGWLRLEQQRKRPTAFSPAFPIFHTPTPLWAHESCYSCGIYFNLKTISPCLSTRRLPA